jgi:hypothetical protein
MRPVNHTLFPTPTRGDGREAATGAEDAACHDAAMLRRPLRHLIAGLLAALALAMPAGKAWLSFDGPYLEALPAYPYCAAAAAALAEDRVLEALELAEAGACEEVRTAAEDRWRAPLATAERCLAGVWTGVGDDAAGVACAIASDLVVFGDVRDLTRQGVAWGRGEATDPLLIGLSTAGLVLTFAPQVDVGTALLKAARRAGRLTRGLADEVLALIGRGAWRAVGDLSTDAARVANRLGVAGGTRALAYADDAAELASLARFVEAAPSPLLALRWGGKQALRLGDDDVLYRAALVRGPEGLRLAAERGGRALLARQPLLVAAAKSVVKHPDELAQLLARVAAWLLRWATWPWVLAVSGVAGLLALAVRPRRRRGRRPSGSPSARSTT